MAELKIKSGSKLRLAYDVGMGKDPDFTMMSTFSKSLDESAFLISIPVKNAKPVVVEDNQKLLIQFGTGNDSMILAGYVDDIIKDGIRKYWKIRRVTEQRQFFKRTDERLKVALKATYMQDTWPVNFDGLIDPEEGMTLDISAGGLALYVNRHFEVGEIVLVTLPNVGIAQEGKGFKDIVCTVCWARETPKGSMYRFACGLQAAFGDDAEKERMKIYVEYIKNRYHL